MHTIPDSHSLYLMGDYHQDLVGLIRNLEAMPKQASLVILGDYDAHTAQDIVDLARIAERHQVVMYLMRGNHDNPRYWQDRQLAGVLETDFLKLLNEIDLIIWRGTKIITVSGAVSVDRTCVRYDDGHCWPELEKIPTDAIQQVRRLGQADVLLTHTGVIDGMTLKNDFINSYASTDEALIEDIKKERKQVQLLQIASGCSKHFFGHFHQSWIGEQFEVNVRCLYICEMISLKVN